MVLRNIYIVAEWFKEMPSWCFHEHTYQENAERAKSGLGRHNAIKQSFIFLVITSPTILSFFQTYLIIYHTRRNSLYVRRTNLSVLPIDYN